MSLDELRREIDEIDDAILGLLNQRAEKVIEVGRIKADGSTPIFDPARERRILDRLISANQGPLSGEAIRDIYGAILAAHRLLEKRLVVAYYGPPGTFSHLAARSKFGSADLRPMDTIADVFAAVAHKEADMGVAPIENTTAGAVPVTFDALLESKLVICAETYVDIDHHLLSLAPSLDEIERVYSHPQPLAQCRIWLRSHLPHAELVPVGSTARAAELAAAEPKAAAIGSALAGELHDLRALASHLQDQPDNRTRFAVVSHTHPGPSGRDKTSLVFSLPHRAGALHRALGVFGEHDINMTFIQSHPTKQTPWEYMFFVDVQGHVEDEALSRALTELAECTTVLRALGSYPEAE